MKSKVKTSLNETLIYKKTKGLISLSAILLLVAFISSCNMETPKETTEVAEINYVTQTKETQTSMTPDEAVQMLKDGNLRFVSGNMINRDLLEQVQQTGTDGQYPFAAIVSCVDSRVPAEIVFDQGIGDIFNGRVAGNFVNTDMLGSAEFAAAVAGSKAIVVLGHTECGAIKGACDGVELENLTFLLDNLEPAVNAVTDITENRNSKNPEFVQQVADMNVVLTVEKIKNNSNILREMYENGELAIIGAMYDVKTGKVTFME